LRADFNENACRALLRADDMTFSCAAVTDGARVDWVDEAGDGIVTILNQDLAERKTLSTR
jgi:hypothetical protein